MNSFLRKSVRLSLFVGWIALQMFSAGWVKGTRHDHPLDDDTEKPRCRFPDGEDGAALALCRRCSETPPAASAAAADEKGFVDECCATAAVQERCQRMTSLRSTGKNDDDDDYDDYFHKRLQWYGKGSSKFLLSRRGMLLFAKRPRNTFLGKRIPSSSSSEEEEEETFEEKAAFGGGTPAAGWNRRGDSSKKRPNPRNKFLGKRSYRSSS